MIKYDLTESIKRNEMGTIINMYFKIKYDEESFKYTILNQF